MILSHQRFPQRFKPSPPLVPKILIGLTRLQPIPATLALSSATFARAEPTFVTCSRLAKSILKQAQEDE